MATSTVPAAVDALLAILQGAAGLVGVRVIDGPPTNSLTGGDWLYIGYQPGADVSVNLAQDFNAAGARTRNEDFDILGYAEARSGGTDIASVRRRAFALLAEIETALRATAEQPEAPTLSGTVQWAHLVTGDLYQLQSDGVLAGVAFSIRCHARI
ncbi:hypothetical protein ACLF6K_37505 [Streptomyces xanthophaeus]|uniref:hypothetical protein n=1 Tax=Streptomyces xanthophaeus TaxID=67385 RepID=UPI003990259C